MNKDEYQQKKEATQAPIEKKVIKPEAVLKKDATVQNQKVDTTLKQVQEKQVLKPETVQKELKQGAKQEAKEQTEPLEAKKQEKKKASEVLAQNAAKVEEIPEQPVEVQKQKAIKKFEAPEKEVLEDQEVQEEALEDLNSMAEENNPGFYQSFKTKTLSILHEYGISMKDLLLLGLGILFSLIILLLLLANSTTSNLTPKKDEETDSIAEEDENKYFIFDKEIQQTELVEPTTVETSKNYELSTYEPETVPNQQGVVLEPYNNQEPEIENHEIINKALNEQIIEPQETVEIQDLSNDATLEDTETANFEETIEETQQPLEKESSLQVLEPVVQSKVVSEVPKQTTLDTEEPVVLSSVEIAPQRGFMCVSYQNKIRLLGYIFDDVFALYNFKRTKLENYSIKFRMSEKTQNGANFIVRVERSKLLINVTKSKMALQVAM